VDNLRKLLNAWKKPAERSGMTRLYTSVEANKEDDATTAYIDGKSWKAEITFSQKGIERLEIKIGAFSRYVRVEVLDQHGHTAWSNPIFLK
jgi:hypothetical protein